MSFVLTVAACSADRAKPAPPADPLLPDGMARLPPNSREPRRGRSAGPDDDEEEDLVRGDPAESGLRELAVRGEGIGRNRSAWVHIPEGKGPFPVVIAFHGGHRRDGLDMAPRMEHGFDRPVVFVFPNGDPDNPDQVGWIGPGKPDVPDDQKDVRFVKALIETLSAEVAIDRDRMYAVGFSNGGYFTHALFCGENDLFAGYAMVSRPIAKPLVPICDGGRPKPVMLIAGTADPKLVNDHDLSVDDTVAFYREKLGCKPDKKDKETLPDKGDSTRVEHEVWTACDGKARLEYYRIEGGGHHWPGQGRPRPEKSKDVDATKEILRLFEL